MWALVPTIVRLKDHDIGTWSAVTNAKIDSVDLTGCRNQSEQVKALVDHMAKISFMEPISDEDFANLSEEGELEAATSLKMAANEFIVANSACYDRMRIDIGKPVTDVVTGAGLFLGDRSQQRRVGGVDGDAVSVWESWLLQTETFGVFAKDDSRDGIVHAAGNLVMEDWMKGVKQFQAQIEEAKTLKVSLRYHQTIFRYMLKLRQHRPRIATQLERKWGNLPEGWKADQNAVPSISLFIGEFVQAMKDAVQSDRAMNRSDSFKRDRRRMIERVNVFIKTDPEEDDSDSDEDTAEPESRAGGKSPQTKASAGLTNKDMLMVAQAQSRPSGQTWLRCLLGRSSSDME